jgi:hypothetical protein
VIGDSIAFERDHRCTAKAIADEVGRMHTAVKS